MPDAHVDFDAPDLAARIERLSQSELDQLPFGVVLLDREHTVMFFSATEARQSGLDELPLGQNFFSIARSASKRDVQARIVAAREEGPVDLEFAFPGDGAGEKRESRVRVQSARQGGVWLFIERD